MGSAIKRTKEAFSEFWDSLQIEESFSLSSGEIWEARTVGGATVEALLDGPETEHRRPSPWLQRVYFTHEGKGAADFHLLEQIGEGGMGQIDLALQSSLQREIVIKSIKPEHATPQNFQSLVREALITGALQHPNIVPVYMLAKNKDDEPLLVMKRIEGVSWKELIKNPRHHLWQKLPGERLAKHLEILSQVANAIHFAHSNGVVHRDIKPRNVMIGEFGEVYVLDWGIALRLSEKPQDAFHGPVGTPSYMAPEMLHGNKNITEQTDVYLLGATLHEILTGQVRHQGENFHAVLYSVFQSEPYQYDPREPRELVEICHRAMHPDPEQRFESAEAFRAAINEYLQKRAALKLLAGAQQRLNELQELLHIDSDEEEATRLQRFSSERRRLYKIFYESRFGFEQYLRDYPEDPSAKGGLRACLLHMFRYEAAQENASAAQELLDEIGDPPSILRQELAALKQQKKAEKDSQEKLKELQAQNDLRIFAKKRWESIYVWLGMAAVSTAVVQALRYSGLVTNKVLSSFFLILTLFLVIIVRMLFFSAQTEQIRATKVNRQMIAALLLALIAMMFNRLLGLGMGLTLPQVLLRDCLFLWPYTALLGFFVARSFFMTSAAYILGVALCLLYPERSPEAVIVLTIVGIGLPVWRLGRESKSIGSTTINQSEK
jgi:serine/threonine protein kinase